MENGAIIYSALRSRDYGRLMMARRPSRSEAMQKAGEMVKEVKEKMEWGISR